MKKYRIIKNKDKYYLQKRIYFFFWRCIGNDKLDSNYKNAIDNVDLLDSLALAQDYSLLYAFKSKKEATSFLRKELRHKKSQNGNHTNVECVFDKNGDDWDVNCFVDGVAEGSTNFTGIGGISPNADLFVGTRNSDHFTGLIDEARIYNRALSQQEIQNL